MFPNTSNSITLKAAADVYACRFVKLSTSDVGSVIQGAAAADVCVGVSSQDNYTGAGLGGTADVAAVSGTSCRFFPMGQMAVLELGTGGATVGGGLVSDSTGRGVAVAATAGRPWYAIALETGAAGDKIRVLLQQGVVTS